MWRLHDRYKWNESGPPTVESIPNKWYCNLEGQPRSSQSSNICTGLLWLSGHGGKCGNTLISLLVTFLLCLEENFPGKRSTAVLQRLSFTSGIQSCVSL
ncbi:hypothetical protein TNCV_3562921 [Trichonephila clavipes]|nr:hypothetical protein TNCV_3562921 [Trichonephila clavipes]